MSEYTDYYDYTPERSVLLYLKRLPPFFAPDANKPTLIPKDATNASMHPSFLKLDPRKSIDKSLLIYVTKLLHYYHQWVYDKYDKRSSLFLLLDYAYGHVLYERVRELKIYDDKSVLELMRQGLKNYNDPSSKFQHQIDLTKPQSAKSDGSWSIGLYDLNVGEELTWEIIVWALLPYVAVVGVFLIVSLFA